MNNNADNIFETVRGPRGSSFICWVQPGELDPVKMSNNRSIVQRARELGLTVITADYERAIERNNDQVDGIFEEKVVFPGASKCDVLLVSFSDADIPYIRKGKRTDGLINEIVNCATGGSGPQDSVFNPDDLQQLENELIDEEWNAPDTNFPDTLLFSLSDRQRERLEAICAQNGRSEADIMKEIYVAGPGGYIFDGMTLMLDFDTGEFRESFDEWCDAQSETQTPNP